MLIRTADSREGFEMEEKNKGKGRRKDEEVYMSVVIPKTVGILLLYLKVSPRRGRADLREQKD